MIAMYDNKGETKDITENLHSELLIEKTMKEKEERNPRH